VFFKLFKPFHGHAYIIYRNIYFLICAYILMVKNFMEQRKIMSLGRSSLVISLPKYWVELNELKQGDVVSIAINRDRSLAIFPGARKEREPAKDKPSR
jgi:hypothetical protein